MWFSGLQLNFSIAHMPMRSSGTPVLGFSLAVAATWVMDPVFLFPSSSLPRCLVADWPQTPLLESSLFAKGAPQAGLNTAPA